MTTDWQVRLLRQKKMEGETNQAAGANGGDERASGLQVGVRPVVVGDQDRAPVTDPSRSLRLSLRGRNPVSASGRDRRQAEGRHNCRVAGGAESRSLQPLAAAHPGTTLTGLASAQRHGPGGLLPPRASSGPRGPVGLHPLQFPGNHHRRSSLPPPAFRTGAQPFGVALRRGGYLETFLALNQGVKGAASIRLSRAPRYWATGAA